MAYNFNGDIIKGQILETTIDNRALNYGDGVFESIKFSNNRLNFWEDHYFRLMSGMRILRMEIPMAFSPEYLEEQILKTVEADKLRDRAARVRLVVFRQAGGLYTPTGTGVELLISVAELPNSRYELNEKGLEVDLFRDYYKQKSLLSTIKTLSSVFYTVASVYRKENDLDECLLLNDDKMVVEAISANVFMVQDQVVFTPPLSSGCLKGVMRKQVLELLPKMGYEVKEEEFSPFELQKADELFLTNATKGIRWVERYRKKTFGNRCAKELVAKLNMRAAIG